MKESVGSIPLYNIIFVFLFITIAFLAGTISYSKAFRVNSRIINIIEKYDGFNDHQTKNEIHNLLTSYGYTGVEGCPTREGQSAIEGTGLNYCVYRFYVEPEDPAEEPEFKYYGVLTYMKFDLPVFTQSFSVPIYTRSDRLFIFRETEWPRIDEMCTDESNCYCEYPGPCTRSMMR